MSRPEPPSGAFGVVAARSPDVPGDPSPPAVGTGEPAPPRPPVGVPGPAGSRYGWFVGVVGLLILVLITLNSLTTKSNGAAGIAPGQPVAPFAVPLALGTLNGDADVATRANGGAAGRIPACELRLPQTLNMCTLYAHRPVALALFVAGGSCPGIVDDLQRLAPTFPGVQIAAVAIRGSRSQLRSLVRARGWTLPVGYDHDGVLANLYKESTCPQVTFVAAGGRVAEPALLRRPPLATLRARLAVLARSGAAGPGAG